MSHSPQVDRTTAAQLQKQLNSDEFVQLLGRTTLFRDIPPSQMPLPFLERVSDSAELITLEKNEALPLEIDDSGNVALYEILSGYVKIYDRKPLKSERRLALAINPPALLAWRVPGELLGDFQFTCPEQVLTDYIVATDKCELLKIPGRVIKDVAMSYPQLYLNIGANLAIKAIKGRVRAQILRLPNIECMVTKLFIELLQERGSDPTVEDCRLINGTFHISDIGAFLGYEYHATQIGISNLIHDELIKHYDNNKSGRFEITDEKKLHEYLQRELVRAAEQRARRKKPASQNNE